MVFTKDISELTFSDIKSLHDNKISESDILDYKQDLINRDDLVKHVCSFANTHGGYIIFGIKESGSGGYPVSVPGIDASAINKERMEQVILSNITPRINIRLHVIDHETVGKKILVLQIPDSQYRPHYNNRIYKFYKRFEFEAAPMTEQEISDMYKNRFHTLEEVEEYLEKFDISSSVDHEMIGQITVIPSLLDRRLIDTSNSDKFGWLDPNAIDPQPSGFQSAPSNRFLPGRPIPFSHGLSCSGKDATIKIHRNGCIQYIRTFGRMRNEDTVYLIHTMLALKIMHVLQFSQLILEKYNYFGDVRIRISLKTNADKIEISYPESTFSATSGEFQRDDAVIKVEREFSTEYIKSNYSQIAASIMDEVFNHCGSWNCYLFDDGGNYKPDEFR